ncbi:MAG: hypothetical protein NTZ51_09320 [Proteobacteria bacterium]|nr:hypothetical protein [Pseudomonadota bacterium]
MRESSDSLPVDDRKPNHALRHEAPADALFDDWQAAEQRLLLYLQVLNVPEQQGLELARETVRCAQQAAVQDSSFSPATAAMRELRRIISGEKLSSGNGTEYTKQFLTGPPLTVADTGSAEGIRSMPPLNRGSMLPVEIDRQPWYTFFMKRILRRT